MFLEGDQTFSLLLLFPHEILQTYRQVRRAFLTSTDVQDTRVQQIGPVCAVVPDLSTKMFSDAVGHLLEACQVKLVGSVV